MKKAKTEKKARAIVAETKTSGLLASTARILSRLVGALAGIASGEDKLSAHVESAKAALAAQIEAAVADWRAIKSEHKDAADRKKLARAIYDALTKEHGLAPQRASDVLKRIGVQLREKAATSKTDIAPENVEQLFLLADKLEGGNGERVTALLSRAYGKGRKVYCKKSDA
jgi:hypothetical protein